eukprot:TRINITY_DN307_c0_g1_i13.p1 TRINITY_DN307_c0_g1~~TRINITY_DN307_c0_g1_i13.p1  ORF type:complete len:128 (-),score=15.29 TRINITY_DN307_c0_g1_i13:14-397(-)
MSFINSWMKQLIKVNQYWFIVPKENQGHLNDKYFFFPKLIIQLNGLKKKQRSATIVISYVMKKYKWDFRQAYNFVREKRKEIATKFEDQLILWHSCNYSLQSENGTKNEVQKEIASKYPRSKFIKYL